MKRYQPSALSIWLMCQKNKTQGLALIEVLAILIIVLVLAAVALPSYWPQTNKAESSEARNIVGAMNRAQQAYFEKKKGAFADSFEKLEIGIESERANYRYFTRKTDRAAFHYGISKYEKVKSYVGAVWKVTGNDGKTTTQSILCRAKNPAATQPADPVYKDGQFICGEGTVKLGD